MKKVFAMAALVLGILILQMPQADAGRVYASYETRRGQTTYYHVITETIQATDYGYKCRVYAEPTGKYWEVGFTAKNGDVYAVLLPSTYTTQITRGNQVIDETFYGIFKVVMQYR